MEDLVRQISFEIADRTSLIASIEEKLISQFEIHTGNEELYLLALYSRVEDLASRRIICQVEDLHRMVLEIKDGISAGTVNPAVRFGWIEPLDFKPDPHGHEEDYYLGKGARPAHILANVDAQRPEWIKAIHDSLSDTPVCIVRSSSGQGKSTLLYRYAYTYFDHHTTFLLSKVQDPNEIAPLERYIHSRLQLGLPVLVLVDDLNERVNLWHELVRRLAGYPVRFLIASREENWFRYFGNLHNLRWKTVKPELSIQEAEDIFRQVERQGRIASNVKSAAWAYDKVATKKLLIEFVFLITQGQMLSERLEDQIATIERLGEDPVKLTILRLASLAQVLDVRISAAGTLAATDFGSDPQQTVKSLVGEYVELTEDGYLEGLHFVRSEHLVSILHDPLPINSSVLKLFELVADDDLPILVRSAIPHPALQHLDPLLLSSLTSRTAHDIALTLEVVRGIFRADEIRYLRENRAIIDEFINRYGSPALVTLFVSANMPAVDEFDLFEAMTSTNHIPEDRLAEMKAAVQLMPSRDANKRVAVRYLKEATLQLTPASLAVDLSAVRTLLIWTRYFEIPFKALSELFREDEWQQSVFVKPIEESADLMYLLWKECPRKYKEFAGMQLHKIIDLYRRETDTLLVNMRDDDIYVEFVVDETCEIHDTQTLPRLRVLMRLLPHFESYRSQGLYPVSLMDRVEFDDSQTNLTKEVLLKDIVEQNSLYVDELEVLVNPDSLYDWLHYWHELRKALLAFVEALIERHESMLMGKSATALEHVLDLLFPLLQQRAEIPSRFKKVFAEQVKHIHEWRTCASNFVHTYRNNRALREDRLYLQNLFQAWGQIGSMQKAFEFILHSGASSYQAEINIAYERKLYRYLYDLFSFWLSVPPNRVLSRGTKPRSAVSAYKKSQRRELKSKLMNAFRALIDESVHVHLPEDYLEEPPMKNLAIGIELQDGRQLLEHVEVICHCMGDADLSYDYVYVLPVINSRPVQSLVYKIHSETVSNIVEGKELGDGIDISLAVTPAGFYQSVRSVNQEVLGEWQFYQRAQQSLCRLHVLRNEVSFVKQRVGDDTSTWQTELFKSVEQRVIAAEDEANELMESASSFRVQEATQEWDTLWGIFSRRVEGMKDSVLDVEGFDPLPFSDNLEVMFAYGHYLNHEYLQSHG